MTGGGQKTNRKAEKKLTAVVRNFLALTRSSKSTDNSAYVLPFVSGNLSQQ